MPRKFWIWTMFTWAKGHNHPHIKFCNSTSHHQGKWWIGNWCAPHRVFYHMDFSHHLIQQTFDLFQERMHGQWGCTCWVNAPGLIITMTCPNKPRRGKSCSPSIWSYARKEWRQSNATHVFFKCNLWNGNSKVHLDRGLYLKSLYYKM